MLFTDLLKGNLVAAANYYKVEVEPNWTKERIATALLDAGKTPEQWERDQEANDIGEDSGAITTFDLNDEPALPEPEEVDVEPEAETVVVDEEPVEEDEELVLVRFTGSNQSYTSRGFTFSRFKPFGLMTEAQFDLLDPKKFRLASKAEAAEFYRR